MKVSAVSSVSPLLLASRPLVMAYALVVMAYALAALPPFSVAHAEEIEAVAVAATTPLTVSQRLEEDNQPREVASPLGDAGNLDSWPAFDFETNGELGAAHRNNSENFPASISDVTVSEAAEAPAAPASVSSVVSESPRFLAPVPHLQVLAGSGDKRKNGNVAIERARVLERAGAFELAEEQLRRAFKSMPLDVEVGRALAQLLERRERWVEASAQWREVLFVLAKNRATSGFGVQEVNSRDWMALRFEAARQLRAAQSHLLQFWAVGDVVTLGADSNNPTANNLISPREAAVLVVHNANTSVSIMRSAALMRPRSISVLSAVRKWQLSAKSFLSSHSRKTSLVRVASSISVKNIPQKSTIANDKIARRSSSNDLALAVRDARALRHAALRWESIWLDRPMVEWGASSDNSMQSGHSVSTVQQTFLHPARSVAVQMKSSAKLVAVPNEVYKAQPQVWRFLLTVPGAHEAWLVGRDSRMNADKSRAGR